MRKFRKSWIGIVLVFLFTISLFFWRSGSKFSKIFDSDNVIATVGNTPISATKFNRTLQMNIQNFNQILGKDLTSKEVRDFQIHKLALGSLVNDAIFENEFNKLNFKLDETIIAKKTKEVIPELYDNNNNLNEIYLKQFLSQQRLKIEDIVQIVHFDTRNEYFNSTLLNIAIPLSVSKKIFTHNNHIRDIEYLKIPIDLVDINNELMMNENDLDNNLSNFYKQNTSQYMSDEERNIKYILIDKKDFISTFMPTENEILDYYNNNSTLFIESEKRSFLQFNFKTLNEAQEFKKTIKNISSYKEVVSYANSENIKYNTFDKLNKDEVIEEISQSLFTLSLNEQSEIIKTALAHHIIILIDIFSEKKLSFNEAKDNIKKTISDNDVNNFLIDLENQISQDILEGLNLEDLAIKYELKLSIINNISKNYNESINNNELFTNNLIKNAFIASLDFTNDIIRLNENKFYTYEVTKIKESQPLKFNDIKNDVFEDWKINKKIEIMEKNIKNNIGKNNFLDDLGNKFNEKIKNISVSLQDKNIPRDLIKNIFKSNINSISYIIHKNEFHISKLLKVNMDKELDISEKISLTNDFRNSLYNELIKETKISTNDQLLDAIIDSN